MKKVEVNTSIFFALIFKNGIMNNNLIDAEHDMHTITLAGKQISPLHIESIQGINGGGAACFVYYFDFSTGRKISRVQRVERPVDAVVDLIREAAQQVSQTIASVNYIGVGEVTHPRVIVAERGSVSGSVCPLCGYTKKVHHSNRCSCSWHKPFTGSVNADRSITKQRIFVFADDTIYPMLSGRVRKFDNTVDGTVYDLKEKDGVISATFVFQSQGKQMSRQVYLRCDDGVSLQALLSEPRHYQWELQEETATPIAA